MHSLLNDVCKVRPKKPKRQWRKRGYIPSFGFLSLPWHFVYTYAIPYLHAEPLLLTHFSEESLHSSLKLQVQESRPWLILVILGEEFWHRLGWLILKWGDQVWPLDLDRACFARTAIAGSVEIRGEEEAGASSRSTESATVLIFDLLLLGNNFFATMSIACST